MTVTVAQIRIYPMNNIPETDASDDMIQGAINQATVYIGNIAKDEATDDEVDAAIRALGGYLAFLSYLGRQVQDVAGAFQDGYFTPSSGTEGIPQIRSVSDTRAKAAALKDAALMFINIISKGNLVNGKLEKVHIPVIGLSKIKYD